MRALLARLTHRAVTGVKAKATVLVIGSAFVIFGAEEQSPVLIGVSIALLAALSIQTAVSVLERPLGVRRLAGRRFPLDDVPPARETLMALRIDPATVDRIVAESADGREVKLASFDQENRLLSSVGPIPYFKGELITEEQFIPRYRHLLDLVVTRGVVAVRKGYSNSTSLENEALALAALATMPGIPRIVHLDRAATVMYQSFLIGENMGSLMAARGASVDTQHEMMVNRPRPGTWTEESLRIPQRHTCMLALASIVPVTILDELESMILRIHQMGVTVGDVKFGNVLLRQGRPLLIDFDWARLIKARSVAALLRRDEERDVFNFSFGRAMPTLAGLRREFTWMESIRPDLVDGRIDFGGGVRVGRRWTPDAGSGLWPAVRKALPGIAGRRIVDVNSRDPIALLELLRADAAEVTSYHTDPTTARFARACQALVEHIDNRRYAFRVVETRLPESELGAGHQLCTALGGAGRVDPSIIATKVARLSSDVTQFLFRIEGDRVDLSILAALNANGFRIVYESRRFFATRRLVLARRG